MYNRLLSHFIKSEGTKLVALILIPILLILLAGPGFNNCISLRNTGSHVFINYNLCLLKELPGKDFGLICQSNYGDCNKGFLLNPEKFPVGKIRDCLGNSHNFAYCSPVYLTLHGIGSTQLNQLQDIPPPSLLHKYAAAS